MTQLKLTLFGAALVGVTLAASAGAQDRNMNSVMDSGDRGITTPATVGNDSIPVPRIPDGRATLPRGTYPMSPNETNPQSTPEYQAPLMSRGDNPNLPNPVTPSAANESAPQPQGTLQDQTNQPGIPRGIGSTR